MTKKPWGVVLKGSIAPLFIGVLLAALFRYAYQNYEVPHKGRLDKALVSLLIFYVTYWVCKITVNLLNWYGENVARRTKTDLDDKFIPLFKRITVTAIWVIGLIILLSRLGVNINALVATLGVGSLAIALAAQDTIANIIAGFLIMVDRPFSIGDDIKLPSGERAKVIDIGIRRSKFIGEDKAIIIVPNLDLSKSKIVNYSWREDRKEDV